MLISTTWPKIRKNARTVYPGDAGRLVQLRQGVAQAIATNKRTEQQYNQSQNEANKWQRNAQLALQKAMRI